MKHRWLIALVAMVALVAGACSSDDDDETTTTTAAETTTTTEAAASFDADQQAAADAFELAFTAEGDEAAAAYAPDAALVDVLTAAAEASASQAGAVGVIVDDVAIDGEIATITFTITLDGAPVAPGQTGYTVMVEGAWKVHVSSLCNVLGLLPPPPEPCAAVEPPTAA